MQSAVIKAHSGAAGMRADRAGSVRWHPCSANRSGERARGSPAPAHMLDKHVGEARLIQLGESAGHLDRIACMTRAERDN